jgi:hypothetical protein
MHDPMHAMMTGMFWGGVVMAVPPVAMTVAIAVYVFRRERAARLARAEERSVAAE